MRWHWIAAGSRGHRADGCSAEDLKLALSLMIGPDPADAIAWTLNLPPPRRDTAKGLKVAVMLEHPEFRVEQEVKDRIHAAGSF